MDELKKISVEDLTALKEVKNNSLMQQLNAEIAKLEHENVVLKIYLKYNLNNDYIINENTGEVVFKEKVKENE